MKEITTIQISKELAAALRAKESKGQTYEEIITNMIKKEMKK